MSFASEFRDFAVKGNVVDLAVGVIISVSRAILLVDHAPEVIAKALKQVLVIFLDLGTNFICLSNLHNATLIILHKF